MARPARIQSSLTTDRQRAVISTNPASILYVPPRKPFTRIMSCTTSSMTRTRPFRTTSMPDNLDSGYDTDMADANHGVTLEQSFDASFAKSQQCAYISVIQGLDLRRRWCKSMSSICSTCPEVVWKGHPRQEKLIRGCDLYTIQWLLERDTTWCGEDLPRGVIDEPELVKAVGAWSLDRVTDVINLVGGIDTVPGAKSGLHDVKSQPSITTIQSSAVLVDLCTPIPRKIAHDVDASVTDVVDVEPGTMTTDDANKDDSTIEESDEVSSTSGSDETDEQVNVYLPAEIMSFHSPTTNGTWTSSAIGSNHVINDSSLSTNSQSSQNIHRPNNHRRNEHKRKRGLDESDDESNRDDNLPRASNAMPLEDFSAKLACHFYTLDKEKYCEGPVNGKHYKRCAQGFKDSKDLRDHLKEKHYGPKWLCSRCNQVFSDCAQKAKHEKAQQRCEEGTNMELDNERYILVGTKRRLDFERIGKKPKNTSHEDRWFDVWRVLFPDRPFPTSPYTPRDNFDVVYERFTDEVVGERLDLSEPDIVRHVLQRMKSKLREALRSDPYCFIEQRAEGLADHRQPEASSTAAIHGHTPHPLHQRPTPFHPNLHSNNIEVPFYLQHNVEASYEYPDQGQPQYTANSNNSVVELDDFEVQFEFFDFHPYPTLDYGSWHRM